MRTYLIKFKAQLENCTQLQPVDTEDYPHDYRLRYQCTRCSYEHPKSVCITQQDRSPVESLRRVANFHSKCRSCKNSIYFIIKRTEKTIIPQNSHEYTPLVEVHSHGAIITSYELDDQFACETNSGEVVDSIDLRGGEWSEYDETGNVPMTILDFGWIIEVIPANSPITTL